MVAARAARPTRRMPSRHKSAATATHPPHPPPPPAPQKRYPAYLQVTDIAGLVRGAAEGAGLGNAFLSHIAAVDGLFHVVRAFDNDEIVHVRGVGGLMGGGGGYRGTGLGGERELAGSEMVGSKIDGE